MSLLLKNEIRIQKYLALCGLGSRRYCENFIKEGRVKVNGNIVDKLGAKVQLNDSVMLDGKELKPLEKIYIVLNKPPKVISSRKDRQNRKTIYDLIDIDRNNIFSLGRLDYESSGLIILTNDGDFGNKISHPSGSIIKEYYVESDKKPPEELISGFKTGVTVDNVFYRAYEIKKTDNKYALLIYLSEGKKREIRNVYEKYALKIKTLRRISIGGLKLANLNLREGEYKEFSREELIKEIYKKNG